MDIEDLFDAARLNPDNPMNEPGRLTGRHCVARKKRGQSKRRKRGKKPYEPS